MRLPENLKLVLSLALSTLLIVLLLAFAQKIITPDSPLAPTVVDQSLEEKITSRMSFGDKILIQKECFGIQKDNFLKFKALKKEAVELINEKNEKEAISYFELAKKYCPNAPENLIYLNNAKIDEQKSYTIATLVHSSIDYDKALEILRGFAQAQWEINRQGGIDGIPLKLLVIDDGDSPEFAKKIANYLVEQEDILAVTGHWTSDVSLAVAPIYTAGKLVFITPNSSTNELSKYNDYVFQIHMINKQISKALAEYVLNNWDIQKVAIFYVKDTTYTEELKNDFKQELETSGGRVVKTFDLSNPNFDAQFSWKEAKDLVAEGLFLITDNIFFDKAIEVIRVNSGELKLIAEANLYSSNTLIQSKADAIGLVMPVSWHLDQHLDSDFVKNAQKLWRTRSVNDITAMSYNAMRALITALQSNQNPNRITIQQALKSPDFVAQGAGEIIKFTPEGTREGKVQLVEVRAKKNGDGYEFVSIN